MKEKKTDMIVKIKLKSKNEVFTMLFGNSYKNWEAQFREYCSTFKPIEVISIETSKADWKGWGGLKWCNEAEIQNELNREGCQPDDPDNPKSRIYSDIVFNQNKVSENIAKKIARVFI